MHKRLNLLLLLNEFEEIEYTQLEKRIEVLENEIELIKQTIFEGGGEVPPIEIPDDSKENPITAYAGMTLFDVWSQDNYKVGDVRTDPDNGYPYECITEHDSISNPDWTIDNRTLWKPCHSKVKEYALPYEAPTGAHDIYKVGEYMIYTDKNIYI